MSSNIMRLLIVPFFIAGCAGTYQQKVDFNPTEPLRVAVMPFVTIDKVGKATNEESRLLLDNLSLVSSKQEETPSRIVRRHVLAELPNTGLDIVSSALIDIDLPHRGFGKADGTLDVDRVLAVAPGEICVKFLDCDAVLYGKIVRWDRSYYGIQSVNTVGIDLKLVSARDGKVLFQGNAEDSESRGITKGPTGISSLVLEPIKGLDSEIIVDLSRSVVQKLLEPLNLKKRPEYLESGPPAIFATSHDAPSGILNREHPLVVVAMGSGGQNASFAIGDAVTAVPMFERSAGHYYGEYISLPGEKFSAQPVKVILGDKYGRKTEQTLSSPSVSLGG